MLGSDRTRYDSCVIDAIDHEILRLLQIDGRMSATALAAEVGLTVAPCHRRIKELERRGVLTGYRAVVDPAAVGLGFQTLVFVSLLSGRRHGPPKSSAKAEFVISAQRS